MSSSDADAYWRRPSDGESTPTEPASPPQPDEPGYVGPPPSAPPPAGWRTPVVSEPHKPRQLPTQDRAALDAAEQEAARFTYGVALLAGAIVLILIIVLCARLVG